MKKQIITGEEAKEQLLEGARLLYEAVSTTLGPKGQNGVIQAFGEPIVTHDGVTVAKSIENVEGASLGAQVGIEMIKASSSKTNDNVGDGTTTSTILAYHLMDKGIELIKKGMNPMVLRRELDVASEAALEELKDLTLPVTTEKETQEVATISSENADIGREVGHMYHVLGKDGMVVVEIGTKPVIEYEIVEGYTMDRGFINPMQITDARTQSTTIKNPVVLVAHQTITAKDIAELAPALYEDGKDCLVIVCDDFKADMLEKALRSMQQDFQVIGVKAPGFGENRVELMKDLAAITGTEAVGNSLPKNISDLSIADLGTCEEIIITHGETVITGGSNVDEYIKNLESKLEATKGQFDKSKIEKRIGQLRAKVGQIHVGGNTEMEAEERKYLVDDAVAATEAALKDGIVPGGATTYVEISRRLEELSDGHRLLKEALLSPFKVLMKNAGLRSGQKLDELQDFGKGFDVLGDGSLVDLKEHGIIDPTMVIKQAITNAVSVAGSVLTTGVLITNKKEKEDLEKDDD
jgi:chaperonin GroEL